MDLVLVLGNQLFDPQIFKKLAVDPTKSIFFMKEDQELATYFRFHKHKIIFFFAAMRTYAEELRTLGYNVHYEPLTLTATKSYEESLKTFIKKNSIKSLSCFEIEDKFFEKRIFALSEEVKITLQVWQSPLFLTSRQIFKDYLKKTKRPFMKTFYEQQRKRLNILMKDEKPVGGAWSFDAENRLALPRNKQTPALPTVKNTKVVNEIIELVDRVFSMHPGEGGNFWLPVDRGAAKKWLHSFLHERLIEFGPFEDAIPAHSDFVFHSVLTPFLNIGLLTPQLVISETLKYAEKNKVPLASLEGFIRQVIGWREFVRGIYQNFSEIEDSKNFFGHKNKLKKVWYEGGTGIPALDRALRRIITRGYAHHIERLMVIGSLMVLLEVDPQEAHRWFMEMFIDSSDWVMGPNVYGMALFSDGGIFATKPYICGSNYLRKMSGDAKGEWCDGVDGLYWGFIKKNKNYFLKNPRLSMMARSAEKIPAEKWDRLEKAANELRGRLVQMVE